MLQACLFFQGFNAQWRTARHLPEGEFFQNHRRQSVLFLGRQLRKRGHGLPQEFSHSPILAQQCWSAHGRSHRCFSSHPNHSSKLSTFPRWWDRPSLFVVCHPLRATKIPGHDRPQNPMACPT